MNVVTNKMQMIFRKDFENRTMYTTGISKKKQDGTYENAYIPVQFKKGVELENKTNIYIKDAWITFFKTKEGKAVFYIFINDFNTVHEEVNYQNIVTKEIAKEIKIPDNELPF